MSRADERLSGDDHAIRRMVLYVPRHILCLRDRLQRPNPSSLVDPIVQSAGYPKPNRQIHAVSTIERETLAAIRLLGWVQLQQVQFENELSAYQQSRQSTVHGVVP